MPRWTPERWAASSGILFAILLVVSNFLAGTPPHYNASSDTIGAYFADHHDALVAQGILGGVLLLLWLWFLASYAGTHRDAGQGRLSTVMYGAGLPESGLPRSARRSCWRARNSRRSTAHDGGAVRPELLLCSS